MGSLAFIRYPGSKAKLVRQIIRMFPPEAVHALWHGSPSHYCEPFVGSGAIAWDYLRDIASSDISVTINDADPGIYSLWIAVRDDPKELVRLVRQFKPGADEFYRFKELDGAKADPTLQGFRKLALHQMSFSGLGYKSGGPLGGKQQSSEYNPECRWSPDRIVKRIWQCNAQMGRFKAFNVECGDFEVVLRRVPDDGFAYLDPPYYVQGAALYKHAMTEADHVRLAAILKEARYRWVLSYDDHPRIRELYGLWADISAFQMTPTMQVAKGSRRKNREIVIRNGNW